MLLQDFVGHGYEQIGDSPYLMQYTRNTELNPVDFDILHVVGEDVTAIDIPENDRKLMCRFPKKHYYIPSLDAVIINDCAMIDKNGIVFGIPSYDMVYPIGDTLMDKIVYLITEKNVEYQMGIQRININVKCFVKKPDGEILYGNIFPKDTQRNLKYDNGIITMETYGAKEYGGYFSKLLEYHSFNHIYRFDIKTRHLYCITGIPSHISYFVKKHLRRLKWNLSNLPTAICSSLRYIQTMATKTNTT